MSMTLPFADAVWAAARAQAVAGDKHAALTTLTPLLSAAAPDRLRLLAHRLAGRLHFAAGRHHAARKHLYAAARVSPLTAEIHFEIGQAFEADPYGCDRRAARRFRRAVKLAPRVARFAAALGRSLVRRNKLAAGVRHLRAAAALAPTDVDVLRVVADGLADAGRPAEAFALVNAARFSAAGGRELAKLAADARFRLAAGPKRTRRPALKLVTAGGVERRDAGRLAVPGPHFTRLRAYYSDRG